MALLQPLLSSSRRRKIHRGMLLNATFGKSQWQRTPKLKCYDTRVGGTIPSAVSESFLNTGKYQGQKNRSLGSGVLAHNF